MKKSKNAEIIEKFIEKTYPLVSEYYQISLQPITEIIKLTLPISTGILIASFSLNIEVVKINLFGLYINSIVAIILIQLIALYTILLNQKRNVESLQKEVIQLYTLNLEKHLKTQKETLNNEKKKIFDEIRNLQIELSNFDKKWKEEFFRFSKKLQNTSFDFKTKIKNNSNVPSTNG